MTGPKEALPLGARLKPLEGRLKSICGLSPIIPNAGSDTPTINSICTDPVEPEPLLRFVTVQLEFALLLNCNVTSVSVPSAGLNLGNDKPLGPQSVKVSGIGVVVTIGPAQRPRQTRVRQA